MDKIVYYHIPDLNIYVKGYFMDDETKIEDRIEIIETLKLDPEDGRTYLWVVTRHLDRKQITEEQYRAAEVLYG